MTSIHVNHRVEGVQDEDAPTIVFVGSLGSDLSMWDPQVAVLASAARIVRYDTRGHGASPAPIGPYSIDDLADDLVALLNDLHIESAHLVGLSLGGMTTLRVAARNPERVNRLAVLCTSALLGPAQGWLDRANSVREDGVAAVADAVLGRWFTPAFAASNPALVQQHRTMILNSSAQGYAGCCEAIASMDLREDLTCISAPTLVMAGRQDPATPPEHLQRIADGIEGSRLEFLDPGSHLVSAEQPAQVNLLLAEHFGLATLQDDTIASGEQR